MIALPPSSTWSAGQRLDLLTKSFMESRFGISFDDVRVHTDPWAAAAAHALQARAFTFGRDIFFAEGEYSPHSALGRRLLAHELVHVVQQRSLRKRECTECLTVGDPGDFLEVEADQVSDQVFGGRPISFIHSDTVAAVRRVVRIDPNSVAMNKDPGTGNAKAVVDFIKLPDLRRLAAFHLNPGFDLKIAAQQGDVSAAAVDPVIKMTGKGELVGDAGDDVASSAVELNFIQIGTVFQLQDTWAGRTANEGHVKMNHRILVRETFLLDSLTTIQPVAGKSRNTAKDKLHSQITCALGPTGKGDSPGGKAPLVIQNRKTKADNFLFESIIDQGFTTVLVSIDRGANVPNIQSFFHVNWKLLWHFQFKWTGGQDPAPTAIAKTAQALVFEVKKGAPTEPADLVALLQNPKPPFFNEVVNAARTNTANGGPPFRTDLDTQLPGLPADFFQ